MEQYIKRILSIYSNIECSGVKWGGTSPNRPSIRKCVDFSHFSSASVEGSVKGTSLTYSPQSYVNRLKGDERLESANGKDIPARSVPKRNKRTFSGGSL